MKHPVLVACAVICVLGIVAFFLVGRPPSDSDATAAKFTSALNSNASTALTICMSETPFKLGGKTYYAHECILEVACKIRATSKTAAIQACDEMNNAPLLAGDQNISRDKCVSYLDNC